MGAPPPHRQRHRNNLEERPMPAGDHTPNRIRKIPVHRKVKYLMNEEEWARKIHDHYFKQTDEAGTTVYLSDPGHSTPRLTSRTSRLASSSTGLLILLRGLLLGAAFFLPFIPCFPLHGLPSCISLPPSGFGFHFSEALTCLLNFILSCNLRMA